MLNELVWVNWQYLRKKLITRLGSCILSEKTLEHHSEPESLKHLKLLRHVVVAGGPHALDLSEEGNICMCWLKTICTWFYIAKSKDFLQIYGLLNCLRNITSYEIEYKTIDLINSSSTMRNRELINTLVLNLVHSFDS